MDDDKTVITVLGTPGHIENAAQTDTDTLRKAVGENTGNLLFQYAVSKMLTGEKRYSGHSDIEDVTGKGGATHMLFPAANHLRLGANWSGLNKFIEASTVPFVVLGLGAQASELAGGRPAIDTICADPGVRAFADTLARKAAFVSLRGSFSQQVCRRLGLAKIDVLGCPSLLINHDPRLGQTIARKLDEARKKARAGTAKIMVAAGAPFEIRDTPKAVIERVLVGWLAKMPGVYVQQSGGSMVMDLARGRYQTAPLGPVLSLREILMPGRSLDDFVDFMRSRQRIYWNSEGWMTATKTHDVTIGTRFHGVMAGIQAGIPGVFIGHDSRTGEMIDSMKLPSIAASLFEPNLSLADALDAVSFDADAFDANRARVAALMTRRLASCGIGVVSYVKDLANAA